MPDITDLLASAAREGSDAPDLTRVARRASTLRRRQQVARSAAALGMALVAVVLSRELGSGPQALEQIPADRAPQPNATSTGRPSPAPEPATGAPAAPGAGPTFRDGGSSMPTPAPTGPPPSVAPAPGSSPRPTRAPAPAGPSTEFPAGASCSASTTTAAPEESVSCRFTATEAGGWRQTFGAGVFAGNPSAGVKADIWLTRDGVTTHVDVIATEASCQDAFVRPGDLIRVTVRQGRAGNYTDMTVGAGAGYGCP